MKQVHIRKKCKHVAIKSNVVIIQLLIRVASQRETIFQKEIPKPDITKGSCTALAFKVAMENIQQ